MKLTIKVPFEKDLSVNHCRMGPKGNWRYKDHVWPWIQRLAWEIKAAEANYYYANEGRGIFTIPCVQVPVTVAIDMRFPSKHKRDDHNYHYVIANAVASGLGIDDKDIRISTRSVTVDRENPGFTIEVSDGV